MKFRLPASTLGNFLLCLNVELLEKTCCSLSVLHWHRTVRKELVCIRNRSHKLFGFWLLWMWCGSSQYKHLAVVKEYKGEGDYSM